MTSLVSLLSCCVISAKMLPKPTSHQKRNKVSAVTNLVGTTTGGKVEAYCYVSNCKTFSHPKLHIVRNVKASCCLLLSFAYFTPPFVWDLKIVVHRQSKLCVHWLGRGGREGNHTPTVAFCPHVVVLSQR